MNTEPVNAPRKQRNYLDMTWWDPYVETIADEDTYLRRKFRQDVTDKATGLDIAGLKKLLREIVASEWHAILPIGFPEGTAADGLRRLDVPVARVLLRRPRQDRAGQVHRPRRGDHEVSLRV